MARTFGDLWRIIALHVPGAPPSLVQEWTQGAYDQLIGKRHWVWTGRETVLRTLAARAITVGVTQGLTAITSAAAFDATDVGRQLRVGTGFTYTIATVTDASNATLTIAYAEDTSAAAAAQISDVYLLMPEDFRSIDTITDQTVSRPVVWWLPAARLEVMDPQRFSYDSRFRVLFSARPSQVPAYAGRITYEAWPRPTAAGSYVLRYWMRTDQLVEDEQFAGILATHTESLKKGALAEAAQWPGTDQQRNPYFNLRLAADLRAQFELACQQLGVMDDDQYLQDLQMVDLSRFWDGLSGSTDTLRASDATVGDYYQGGI